MPFTLAKTWKQRAGQGQEIKDKCNAIVNRLALPKTDARAQAMIHVRQLCSTLALLPIKLLHEATPGQNVTLVLRVLGSPSTADLKRLLGDLKKNVKVAFLTMVQFALEHCIKQIVDALPCERASHTFACSAKQLVQMTGVKPAKEKLDLLLLPAYIRNTLHSNGIHRHNNKTFAVDGETYAFVQGERFSSASWSHIFHVIFCALSVYEEIFLTAEVCGIEHIEAP